MRSYLMYLLLCALNSHADDDLPPPVIYRYEVDADSVTPNYQPSNGGDDFNPSVSVCDDEE